MVSKLEVSQTEFKIEVTIFKLQVIQTKFKLDGIQQNLQAYTIWTL